MNIINLPQEGQAWLDWRMDGITATEASIICGTNPYEDIETLFLYKTGQIPSAFQENSATLRGKEMEPHVRNLTNLHFNENFQPVCVEHSKKNYLRASLDGLSECGKILLEVKCPTNYVTHKKNYSFEEVDGHNYYYMPEYYRTQLAFQLFCTGAEKAIFVSYLDTDIKFLHIYPDIKYQKWMLRLVEKFWQRICDYKKEQE